MSTPYRTEVLNDSNLKDVKYLYETIFRQPISLSTLQNKYDTGYTGAKHLTYLAYDGNEPIAFYGALPQRMNYKGRSILAVHTCDSLTLPAYQGQGIHKMLALKAYALMKDHGVKFVYAYHSENTFHSCKKLGWDVAFTMKGFSVRTGGIPWSKAANKIKPLSPGFYNYALRVLKPYQVANSEFSNSNNLFYHEYNEEFFSYKQFSTNTVIKLDGVLFWLKISNRICVGDVIFDTVENLMIAIKQLKVLARKLGLTEVLFQTTPKTVLEQALSLHFQSFESWKVGYLLFDNTIEIADFQGNYGDLDTF